MNWLKNQLTIGIGVLLHSLFAIGVLVAFAGLVIGFLWLNHSGILAKAVPAAPVLSPVKVRVKGPTMIIRGGQYMFTADVTGPAGTPEWSMLPAGAGALHVSADGKSAEFSTLEDLSLIHI